MDNTDAGGIARQRADGAGGFSVTLDSVQDYEFRVKFDGYPDILMDEPAPVGSDKAPNPSRLLAAAVGGCLSSSLLYCAKKLRLDPGGIHSEVNVEYRRNERGRLRIGKIEVEISPDFRSADEQRLRRCLELFEDFCVVTQSVRQGIEVAVKVNA